MIIIPGLPKKIPVFSDPAPGRSCATTYEQMTFLSNPAPGENLLSGNLVIMETGCTEWEPPDPDPGNLANRCLYYDFVDVVFV